MNLASTSSFIGYVNGTSSGGNNTYFLNTQNVFFFNNGIVETPTMETLNAIKEAQYGLTETVDDYDCIMDLLNC